MLIIQYLLATIALILLIGLSIVVAYLHDLNQNQNRGAAAQLDYLSRILGQPNEDDALHHFVVPFNRVTCLC